MMIRGDGGAALAPMARARPAHAPCGLSAGMVVFIVALFYIAKGVFLGYGIGNDELTAHTEVVGPLCRPPVLQVSSCDAGPYRGWIRALGGAFGPQARLSLDGFLRGVPLDGPLLASSVVLAVFVVILPVILMINTAACGSSGLGPMSIFTATRCSRRRCSFCSRSSHAGCSGGWLRCNSGGAWVILCCGLCGRADTQRGRSVLICSLTRKVRTVGLDFALDSFEMRAVAF